MFVERHRIPRRFGKLNGFADEEFPPRLFVNADGAWVHMEDPHALVVDYGAGVEIDAYQSYPPGHARCAWRPPSTIRYAPIDVPVVTHGPMRPAEMRVVDPEGKLGFPAHLSAPPTAPARTHGGQPPSGRRPGSWLREWEEPEYSQDGRVPRKIAGPPRKVPPEERVDDDEPISETFPVRNPLWTTDGVM